jgi:hypothetical protein
MGRKMNLETRKPGKSEGRVINQENRKPGK